MFGSTAVEENTRLLPARMVSFSAHRDGGAEGITRDVSNTQGKTTQGTAGQSCSFSGQDHGHDGTAENKMPVSKEYPER